MPISAYSRKLAPPGDEPYARIKWQGPTSYARVATPGTGTATAGDPLPAVLLGVQEIMGIEFAGTYSGNFEVVAVRVNAGSWILMWRALAGLTVGFFVVATELLLEHTVDTCSLLLFTHLQQVLRVLGATATVLAGWVRTDLNGALG